jgi:hypothetical protein
MIYSPNYSVSNKYLKGYKMSTTDFYGDNFKWFVGVVKAVIDENLVQVRIFGVHPTENQVDVDDSDLPYAIVTYPTSGGQSGSGTSTHNLQVDSWVVGFFVDPAFCMQPVILAVLNGGEYSSSTYGSNGGKFVGEGGKSSSQNPTDIDITATTNIPGGSNVEKTYNYTYAKIKAEGTSADPHLHASALVGCLQLESSQHINPAIEGGYKGRAWGICQWLNPRRAQLFNKFGPTKQLDQQLDFMWWELNNTEARAKKAWLSATTLPDAVAGFEMFERNEMYNLRTGTINRGSGLYKQVLSNAYKIYNSAKYSGS